MKIDFNYKFKTLDGEEIRERPDEETEDEEGKKTTKKFPPFTLRKACVSILLAPDVDGSGRPKEMSGEDKIKRYELAKKIHKTTGLVDLQAEEIVFLKELIGRNYPTLTTGQAIEILDPHGAAEKKTEPHDEPPPQVIPEEKSRADN